MAFSLNSLLPSRRQRRVHALDRAGPLPRDLGYIAHALVCYDAPPSIVGGDDGWLDAMDQALHRAQLRTMNHHHSNIQSA